jgi:peptide/nickel transport system ATP-binding protein
MTDAILETRDLVKRFPLRRGLFAPPVAVRAVDGVTLSIRRGETFAIVGESGCGKSTFARLLIRLLAPTSGRVLYAGRDIAALPEREMRRLRRDLQFVFQDPFSSLNPQMTVGALIEEPMRAHGLGDAAARRREAAALLERVGLRPEHASRHPHEFSGGQRQRIGIARALATRPTVLVADEPVSALDVSVQAQVINLLEGLKTDFGLTLVIIAHDLAVIRHMSDRVGVMYLGEMVETGPTEAVFAAPRHPYTAALLAAIPAAAPGLARTRSVLQGETPNPADPPPGCRFHTRCPNVRPRCGQDHPPALTQGPGRAAACWFSAEIGAGGAAAPPPRSPAAAARFALWRAARARASADA